ncbi:MAG: type II toxin-antitoxin system RelE/ParE family toxin [Candidatus Freyrarchaeum guaymaensis]
MTERLCRIRVGEYRIIYQVDIQTRDVIIYYIRHQRKAYRKL